MTKISLADALKLTKERQKKLEKDINLLSKLLFQSKENIKREKLNDKLNMLCELAVEQDEHRIRLEEEFKNGNDYIEIDFDPSNNLGINPLKKEMIILKLHFDDEEL